VIHLIVVFVFDLILKISIWIYKFITRGLFHIVLSVLNLLALCNFFRSHLSLWCSSWNNIFAKVDLVL
jgi:hypothetical protein